MSENDELCIQRIRRHSHYQQVDYDRLAARVGKDLLRRRLERQLVIYDKLERHAAHPLYRHGRQVFRSGIRTGLFLIGQLEAARRLARRPQRVEREIFLPELPEAFDGYRILQLSDFHFDFTPEMPELLPQWLEGLAFDLCVLTGDYRGETTGPYDESMRCLERCRPLLGPEVYAVLGNHDNIEIMLEFPRMGIQGLLNEAVWLERGGQRILLAGIDDAHHYKTQDFGPFLEELNKAETSILLSHSPEAYAEAAFCEFDLMLSGHTHGGQLCLPGGIPVLAHLHNTPRKMIRGAWTWQGMQGYTSRGIGASSIDCRWFCPPEITVHTLRRRHAQETQGRAEHGMKNS